MSKSGGAGESRTPDTQFRKLLLYPSELQPHRKQVAWVKKTVVFVAHFPNAFSKRLIARCEEFRQRFHVHIHRSADIRMTQDPLEGFIGDARQIQVRSESPPKSVSAVPFQI
jgi:hypothetical protein